MSNVEVDDYAYKKLEKAARQIILKHTGETRSVTGLRNNNWVFLAREKKPYYLVKFVPPPEKKRLGPDYPIEEFYRGYNSRKKLPESFFQDLDFYKFYRLATMVSYQLKVEGERIAEERFQGMQQKLQNSLGELENFKSYR